MTELGRVLEEAGMTEVFTIPRARIPVVKFKHAPTGDRAAATIGAGGGRVAAWTSPSFVGLLGTLRDTRTCLLCCPAPQHTVFLSTG